MNYNVSEIRARIAALRVLNNKSFFEMANLINVRAEEYIQFENGKKDFSLEQVITMLNALGYKLTIEVIEEE